MKKSFSFIIEFIAIIVLSLIVLSYLSGKSDRDLINSNNVPASVNSW